MGIGFILRAIINFINYRIIHVDDSPNRIATGAAIGLFIAWTPAIGLHTLIILAITSLTKANKFVAITFSLVFNIFTSALILYPNYLLGRVLLAPFRNGHTLTHEQVITLFRDLFASGSIITNVHKIEFWQKLVALLMNIGPELWIGGFIIGGTIAIAGYFTIYNFVKWERKKTTRKFLDRYNNPEIKPKNQKT